MSFCPCCGAKLRLIHPDDEWWGDFAGNYRVKHGTEWFLCTGERDGKPTDCFYTESPLVLHNPIHGWDRPPGDNWAIGYVK